MPLRPQKPAKITTMRPQWRCDRRSSNWLLQLEALFMNGTQAFRIASDMVLLSRLLF